MVNDSKSRKRSTYLTIDYSLDNISTKFFMIF